MEYGVSEENLTTGKTIYDKWFKSVDLNKGKEMIGQSVNLLNSATMTISKEEKLFVIDESGNKTAEIAEDGNEQENSASYILGDADNSGAIDITDATFVQRKLADIKTPLSDEILQQGDADGSGTLELIDATAIQYYLVNMKTPYLIGVDVYTDSSLSPTVKPDEPDVDNINPCLSLSYSHNIADSQTVTLKMVDDVGIAQYGFARLTMPITGTVGSYDFVDVSSETAEINIDKPGLYYFIAVDGAGNRSASKSVVFTKYQLEPNGGTVGTDSVLVGGSSFALPIPTRDNMKFIGWSTQKPEGYSNPAIDIGEILGRYDTQKYLFANWKDTGKRFDTTPPTLSVSYDNLNGNTNTVKLNMSDNSGIMGYYYGHNIIIKLNKAPFRGAGI